MARIRYNSRYSDTREELTTHKDVRRGACEDAFWDENELVDHRSKTDVGARKRLVGCPGNDGNAHVYVWQKQYWYSWYNKCYYSWELKLCCGCEKRASRKSYRNWKRE